MTDMQKPFEVTFPPDFDERELEIADDGIFREAELVRGGQRATVTFYDVARMRFAMQVFETGWTAQFAEPNLIVLKRVDRAHILAAIEDLAKSDFADLG